MKLRESQRAWQKVGEVNLLIARVKRDDQNAEAVCWLGMPHDRAAWHREGVASGRLKELRKMRKMLIRVALCAEADEARKRTAALKVGDVVTVRARVVKKEEGRVIFKKEDA